MIRASYESVLTVLSDPATLGRFYTFVEKTEKRDKGAIWHLKDQQRRVTRTPFLLAEVEFKDQHSVSINAEGENLRLKAFVSLKPIEGNTEVSHNLTMEIKGALGTILNVVISANVDGQAKVFLKNLKEYVEKTI